MYSKSNIFSDEFEEWMMGHEESLTVLPETCVNSPCNGTCEAPECKLCWHCQGRNQRHDLHVAYRENKHRGAMKRVFPPSKVCFKIQRSRVDLLIVFLNSGSDGWIGRWIPFVIVSSKFNAYKVVHGNVQKGSELLLKPKNLTLCF